MMKTKRLAQNYIYQITANLVTLLVPLIMTPYLSRVLGPEGIGISSYTGSVVAAFGMFAVLGAHDYGRLEVAANRNDPEQRSRVFWEIFFLKCGMCLVVVPLYFFYVWKQLHYTDFFILQAIFFLSILTDTSWFYQGMEEFRKLALRTIITRLGSIVLILMLVRKREDLKISLLISLLTTLLSNLVLCIPLRNRLCRIRSGKLQPLMRVGDTITFFLPILAAQMYLHIDKMMLGSLSISIEESGFYEQTRKVTEIITTIVVTINTVMVPRIALLYARGETEEIKKYYKNSLHLILLLALPSSVGLFLISDPFVLWFFGQNYDKVATLLKMSGVLILFTSLGNYVGSQYLIPTHQQNKATVVYALAGCLNIVLNLLLIPRYYSVGAMTASIIAEGISCAVQLYLLLSSSYRFDVFGGIYRYLIGTAVMFVAVWYARTMFLGLHVFPQLLAEVALGAIVYTACLFAMREPMLQIIWNKWTD